MKSLIGRFILILLVTAGGSLWAQVGGGIYPSGLGGGGGTGVQGGALSAIPTCDSGHYFYVATDQPLGQQFYACSNKSGSYVWQQVVQLGNSGGLAYTNGQLDIPSSVIPFLANAQTFTGVNTFNNQILSTTNYADGTSAGTWQFTNTAGNAFFTIATTNASSQAGFKLNNQAGTGWVIESVSHGDANLGDSLYFADSNNGYVAPLALWPSGHSSSMGPSPSVTSCTNGALDAKATDHDGSVSFTGSASTCTVTFQTAYTSPWPHCVVSGSLAVTQTISTTGITVAGSFVNGSRFDYQCSGK